MLISLLLSLDRRAVAAGIVGLRMDRRTPVLPRPRLFELRRHLNEQILPTEGCYELRPDRQPRRVPVQWQRNRRLARHIVRGCELYQRQQALPSPGRVVRGCDQSAERRRWLGDRWGQQEVKAICPPLRHTAGPDLQPADCRQIPTGREPAPTFGKRPGPEFHVLLGDCLTSLPPHLLQRLGSVACNDICEVLVVLLLIQRGGMGFFYRVPQ